MRRIATGIAVLAALMLGAAPASASIAGDCTATLNGVAVDRIDSISSPLVLHADETLTFAGTSPQATTARLSLLAGPVEIDSGTMADAATSFRVSLPLDEISPYSIGLVRVRGTTDGCTVEAWLRISGRFPLATLAGLTGAGLAVSGLAGQMGSIASRRRWSPITASLGGVFTGAGGAVLAQQWGRLQPSYLAFGACIVAAMLVGLLVALAVGRPGRRRRRPSSPAQMVAVAERVTTPRRREPSPEPAPPVPYWCYVLNEVEVFGLTDHTRLVGSLRPGTWYLAKREVGGWVHVTGPEGLEGWAAQHALRRQG